MLKLILKPNTCKECKICCNYSKESLWDIPGFTEKEYKRTILEFPEMKAISYTKNNLYYFTPLKKGTTYLCPFLSDNGCKLGNNKPFKCAIWPLYVVTKENEKYIAVSKVCPNIPNITPETFKSLLFSEYQKIQETVRLFPELIETNRDFFKIIIKL